MKIRKQKKQIKKVIGFLSVSGEDVVNVVTNPEYGGGSCVARDEDCYICEITYTRKRYGAPLYVKPKYQDVFWGLYYKIHYRI